jgi:hypothetical protein
VCTSVHEKLFGPKMMVLSQLLEELQKCYLHQNWVEFYFQFNGDVKYPGSAQLPAFQLIAPLFKKEMKKKTFFNIITCWLTVGGGVIIVSQQVMILKNVFFFISFLKSGAIS